jgi:hypothetical protein
LVTTLFASASGVSPGRITPALWADLGYVFVGDRFSSHFVSPGMGVAAPGSLAAGGYNHPA